MKHIFKLMLLIMALVIAPMTAQADKTAKTNPNVERYNVSDANGQLAFGKSYYEVNGYPSGANGYYYSPEHSNWSMKGWPNADANKHVVTYIHFPSCSTNAQIQLTTTGAVTFVVKVYCMEDPNTVLSTKTVNIPTGTDQWVTVMDSKTFSQKAWYKFDIQCTSGAANVGEFKYWKFSNSLSEPAYTADYMSSPSVHLNGWSTTDPNKPASNRYDWVYQEVMIPEGDDVVGTYCMSLGVLSGYMGIQKDSDTDYPIIFSMWDNGSTDSDPNLPDYLRSGALDAGPGVTIARFGGEGTGAQAKFRTAKNWEPGKWVKFITNSRPEVVDVEVDDPDNPGQKKTITYTNTLTSSWVWADGIDTEWRYIATIRQSGANNFFDGWYSFLEDYNWPSGQWKRNAYFRRGGLHSMVDGKWYNANHVGFGHTDGGNTYGDRDDYGHGKTTIDGEEAFYLTSGGYHESVTDTENTLTLITDLEAKVGTPISQATLTALTARVDQAIKKEQEAKLAEDFENSRETLAASGFTVVYVNSEATNEGDANKKEAAIDGNENTYWHSRWSGGTGNYDYPFYIDIQLSEEMQAKEIEQIAFVFRTGNKSYVPKKLQLQYSANNSTWTPYSEVYNIENVATSTVNLTTKVTGKKYLRLYFAEGYSDCLAIKEIYFRTAVGRDALNEQIQAILDKENRFDGYSTSDLAALKTAYNSGNWTDAQTIKTALSNLASNGTLLKYGIANGTNALSSFKAYQLYNAKGLGDLIVKTTPAVADDNDVDVTDLNNNWQLLRSEKWNAYYLYNPGAEKYLAFNNGTAVLTDKPTPVQVGTRSNGNTFEGFTFQFDTTNANSFLTAPAASAPASVRGMNKVAPENTRTVSLGANTTDGAVWQLRDNYGVTPSAVSVNELLEEADEEGASFSGVAYSIKLNGTNLYLTTTEVNDNSNKTYSLSATPEYFRVVSSGSGFTLQSATTGKYVGEHSNGWDCTNQSKVWTIANIEGGVTTILDGSNGLGVDNETAGAGVFTNKTSKNQWIFTRYESQAEEPEPTDGPIKMSTNDKKYYYSIRNNNNPGNYAHYAGASANLALNGTKDASAVFYFTPASDYSESNIAVNIHNFTAGNLVMNDWASWGETPSLTWYISDATGTTGQTDDWNIRRTNSGNNYWNHQSGGVKSWSAGGDRGSGWYIEEVPTTELTVAVHGLTGQGGVAYNGTTYTNGQKFTAFFENPTIEAASVNGYSATVTIYKGVANVDYTETDPFFSTSTTNAVYHKIAFNSNKNIVISTNTNTDGQYLTSTKSSSYASDWAFIGTIDNFVLYDGTHYVGMKNDFLAPVSTMEEALTLKIVKNGDGIYGIVRPSSTGQGFNSNAGVADGRKIGFYGVGDNGSKVVFYATDGTTLDNPTFPRTEYDIQGAASFTAPSKNTLWYTEAPGTDYNNWMEYSLPIGNGDFGGSVFGAVMNDKITVNEKSLWDGKSETNYSYLGYVKLGTVWVKNLSNAFDNGVKNYVRYLDIDNAVAGVEFSDAAGTKYTRTYIASEPDKVMAVRYTATGANKLNLQFTYEPGAPLAASSENGKKPVTEYAASGLVGTAKFNGKLPIVSYASQMSVKATDGTVTEDYKGITVSNATEVIVYLAGGTDFTAAHPATSFVDGTASQLPGNMASRISAASAKSWDSVLSAHKDNFQSYMGRVAIDLKKNGASVTSSKTTKALVDYYNASADNKSTSDGLYLEQLYYNYGRYLLISSNRNSSVPNNLQGLWVDTDSGNAPWHSDIHTNINIQMNYWPAEPNNLSDLHKPLLDHIKMLADAPGPKNQARTAGQNVGWVINTESNLFGGMSTFKSNYTIANAWYVTHLWQHYRYTLDKTFLQGAFPAMLGAAKYWSARLVQGSDGSYECPSEWSPEHGPDENATAHSQQLVRELFDNTIAAANAINAVSLNLISQAELNDLTTKRAGLDLGLRTESYTAGNGWNSLIPTGTKILKEWKTSPYTVGENQHRHTSHLMALYPFSQLTQDVTTADGTTYTAQQLFDAAKASLTQRSDNSTGWAMGWRVNLWARALDGNHARTLINNALKHARSYGTDQGAGGVYYNLWDGHAPFQIDGNFGVCAGISEMLLQSHTGVIQLLPALPDAWAEGSITGLKAVGNFQVDQKWANKQLTKATIVNKHSAQQNLVVKYGTTDLSAVTVTLNGETVTPTAVTGGYQIANVPANGKVVINISGEVDPEEDEDVPEPSVTATYTPAVYPAQQEIVGDASLDVTVGSTKTTYTFSNDVLAAQFVKKGGKLMFNGSTVMNLKPGTELFTIKFGNNGSTVVNASDMTLVGNVETGSLTADTDAVKGAEHFAGKYIKATFTHEYEGSNVTFVWKAELRDGSHYLRTDLTMTADKDVQMNAIIPMQYAVDAAAAGSTPAVVGNTRGAVLMSDKIFAGLETPTAYNSVISETTVPERWKTYNAWTGASDFSWAPNELPTGITSLSSNYNTSNVVGARGYLKFETAGSQTVTFNFKSGSHKLNIVGVDVLDTNGTVVAHDYHQGFTGGNQRDKVYTLNIPSAGYYQVRYFITLLNWSEGYGNESISSTGNIAYSGTVSAPTVLFDLDPVAPASTRRKVLSADHIANNEAVTDTWDTSTNAFVDMTDADVPARIVELGHTANNIYYREQDFNISTAGGTLTTTFTYKGGSNRLQIVGVDLVDSNGDVAVNDYHFGFTGNAAEGNTYSFIVPAAGQYKLRYLVSKQGEALTSNGDIAINYEVIDYLHLPAPAEVTIQGLWSRQTTLKASTGDLTDKDVVWNVSSVVGLVDPNHKRRSFLAYSERERAVPWRPFPHYNSWYELNINRNNAAPGSESTNSWVAECTPVVEAWKTNLFDRYNVGIKSFVWDDGWDEYGEWHHHSGFPNGFKEPGQVAVTMNSGIGAWLGPVGGYGQSGNYRRDYWNGKGGMQLSNKAYYDVFKAACTRLVKTEAERDGYEFNFFKFDGISGQFSSVGPDDGATGNENAEGIIGCERYVRENLKADIFFNTTVGTWASPFWYHFSDATWRQENDFGTIGNNSSSRENWITYRDRLVYQNYIQRSPICPINTLMTHGFILHQRENGNFDGVSNDLNYQSVLNELRCAFACGSGMVELYADHRLMTSINGGKLWSDLADCLKWQEANKDVLPDIHWVGGNPWTGSKAEIYGWAAWNGEKATLTLRNGAPSQQTFTTTLRDALDIPASCTSSVYLVGSFDDLKGSLKTIAGIDDNTPINLDTEITFTLPASSVYVFDGSTSEIIPETDEVGYTLNPEEGDVEQSDLSEIAITFTESSPIAGGLLEMEQVYPTLSNGTITITANSVGTRGEDYDTDYITFTQADIAKVTNGTWTLTIPTGTFYEFGVDMEMVPVAAITATYTVTSGSAPVFPAAGEYYMTIECKDTGRHPYLYNDAREATYTLQSQSLPSTLTSANNYVWRVYSDGSNLAIYNGDGRSIGVNGNVKMRLEDAWQFIAKDNGYYYLTNPDITAGGNHNCLNASNGGYTASVGGATVRTATTWTGDGHNDNLWKFTPVDYSGFTVYDVVVTGNDEGYAIYNGQNAFTFGFFFVNGTLSDGDVTAATFEYKESTVTIDNTNHTITVAYTGASEVEILQDKIENLLVNENLGTVGYPDWYGEEMMELAGYSVNFGEGVTESNYDDALEAYNAVLETSNIILPEDGKAYKLMAVHVDADGSIKNAYTIYSTADGQITGKNEEADGAIGDEGYTRFIARRVSENNEFILVNELGRYLCWFDTGDSGKSFSTKGATEAYDATYSPIVLEHATTDATNNESGVKALTAEQRFGLFQMKGHPKNANTQYQYFVYDDGNSHRFVSGNPGHKYYNAAGRHTFLFQLVEDESYTYNKPTLIKGNDGHYYASIYLPYPMQVSSEVECYRGTEDRGGSLALEQVNKDDNAPVPAGGYVLYSEQVFTDSDEYSETFGEVLEKVSQLVIPATANPAAVDNLFTGSTVNGDAGELWAAELEGNNPYVLANKSKGIGFYRYTATSYPKGKAIYLAGGASTRERIGFQFDDIVEAIKAAKGEETDNTVFDLTGRRLEKAAKGVNIMGGKKVLK